VVNTGQGVLTLTGYTGTATGGTISYSYSAVGAIDNDSIRSVLELLATADPDRKWTPRDIIKHRSIGGLGPVLVGGPKTVADEMERWVDVGGIDGFNLAYAITPGTFEDLVEFIVPELQRRGRVRTSMRATPCAKPPRRHFALRRR